MVRSGGRFVAWGNRASRGPASTGTRRVRRPYCCYGRTTRRDAGTILRDKHLQLQRGSLREPNETDRSPEGFEGLTGRKRGRPFRFGIGWVAVVVAWVTTKTPR